MTGNDAMRDVHAKLRWAENHLAQLMELANDYLRPGGGDERPLGIQFDNSRPPMVVAAFSIDTPMPIEVSLHAGDLVHNTRSALDHAVARLKDHFGGDARQGTFPITESDADWTGRIYPRRDGKRVRGPLDGLPCAVVMAIYREQPHVRYAGRQCEDPLVSLGAMDNADKHRLLYHSFAYPTAARGLDLIEIRDRNRVLSAENVWSSGEPLVHGTVVARYRVRGLANDVLRVDRGADVKLTTGRLGDPQTTYEAMVERVRAIAETAAALIDAQP